MKEPDRYGVPIDDIFPTDMHQTVHDELEDSDRDYRGFSWGDSIFTRWNYYPWYFYPPF